MDMNMGGLQAAMDTRTSSSMTTLPPCKCSQEPYDLIQSHGAITSTKLEIKDDLLHLLQTPGQ